MLVLEEETYRTFVEGQPKAKEYLNKPILLFDELRLVCGEDHGTDKYARTIFHPFGVLDPVFETTLEGLDNMESDPLDDNDHKEQSRSSSSNCNSMSPQASRTSNEDIIMTDIALGIGKIASSLKWLKKKNWKEKLTDALETLLGYSVEDMNLLYVTLRGVLGF
ncbi:hypothetical protein J5N97_029841 [Dioscorea zingiberensis]|uniref:Uncharacterized protein n=1 Tax=Dioscorea zingiberensis TaxID=325984 RepID=A0A9D5H3K0_9LILI|nr:hypothetical protein J5N97_029841 [Dioscorea zingiberensis]